ncbi:MAG: zf-HC2 domain-containing protein [Planctomycetia bacterium]|nr:zf-HC2 domain-containing protein [Planctomycetia bacterium]
MNPIPEEELLSAYLDGELPAAERAAVETRLAEDADWRAALAELREIRAELDSLPQHTLGADFAAQVLRRIERRLSAAPAAHVDRPEPSSEPAQHEPAILSISSGAAAADGSMSAEPARPHRVRAVALDWRRLSAAAAVLAATLLLMVTSGPFWQPGTRAASAARYKSASRPEFLTSWSERGDDKQSLTWQAASAASQPEAPPLPASGGGAAGALSQGTAPPAGGPTTESAQRNFRDAKDLPKAGARGFAPLQQRALPPSDERVRLRVEQDEAAARDPARLMSDFFNLAMDNLQRVKEEIVGGHGAISPAVAVAHIEVTEEAWRDGSFRKLVEGHGIDWEPAASAAELAKEADARRARRTMDRAGSDKGEAEIAREQAAQAPPAQLQLVVVEASREQLEGLSRELQLKSLSRETMLFFAPAEEDRYELTLRAVKQAESTVGAGGAPSLPKKAPFGGQTEALDRTQKGAADGFAEKRPTGAPGPAASRGNMPVTGPAAAPTSGSGGRPSSGGGSPAPAGQAAPGSTAPPAQRTPPAATLSPPAPAPAPGEANEATAGSSRVASGAQAAPGKAAQSNFARRLKTAADDMPPAEGKMQPAAPGGVRAALADNLETFADRQKAEEMRKRKGEGAQGSADVREMLLIVHIVRGADAPVDPPAAAAPAAPSRGRPVR